MIKRIDDEKFYFPDVAGHVVEGNLHQAWNYGRDTFLYALGIAAGMSIAWAICDFLRKIRGKQEIS